MIDDADEPDDIDYALEWKLRAIAVPVAFALSLLFYLSPTGHSLQRTFLTMIPHELGHATTAWLAGITAIPSVWKTLIFGRGWLVPVLVGAGNVALLWFGWRRNRMPLLLAGVALGGLQLVLTTTDLASAQVAITFGGDAGAMIIGTLLVLTFFAPAGSAFRKGALRWGLLVIGAATVTDTFATWWTARTDPSVIPFGEIEGVGGSDPTKLAAAGWPVEQIVDRYVLVGGVCVAVIVVATAWFTYRAHREA